MTNLLPLETFRRTMGFDPFHFWGMGTSLLPIRGSCDGIIQQHSWQDSDAVGRAQIAEAIATAEGLLHQYLQYWPAPTYVEEVVPWPRYDDHRYARVASIDPSGHWLSVQLPDGYVQVVGVESYTLLGTVTTAPGGGLVFSDQDGDGINDTFVATLTVPAGTDPLTLGCYFGASDRLDGEDVSERWRIAPTQVAISGTTATLRGRFWQLVRPILYEGVNGTGVNGLDPNVLTNFVSSLDIYERTTNPNGTTIATAQGVLEWETRPCHGWWCCCSGCAGPTFGTNASDPAAVARAVARVGIRNAERGIVFPAQAVRNATSGEWSSWASSCWEPDRATVRYLAGHPLDRSGQMDRDLAVIVVRLAAAELARPICACQDTNAELYRWQFDLTLSGRQDELYATNDGDLDNPLGTRRGHVFAWKQIRRRMQLRAVTM